MYCCYEDSVIDAADDQGNLSAADAIRLLDDHGATLADFCADTAPLNLKAFSAEALLEWLGY